jgi:hypothetical protein
MLKFIVNYDRALEIEVSLREIGYFFQSEPSNTGRYPKKLEKQPIKVIFSKANNDGQVEISLESLNPEDDLSNFAYRLGLS